MLPVALFFVSKTFSNKAEKSANKFTIALHKKEKIHLQKLRSFEIINDIYKNCHKLHFLCAKKKRADELAKMFSGANDKIIESGSQQVILQQQENLMLSILRNSDLKESKVECLISLHSNIGFLSIIIGDEEIKPLQGKLDVLRELSSNIGEISSEVMQEVVLEINRLSDRIISGEVQINSV
ncbi:MAG: hypothetical protein GXP14_10350, partial [Gammaproteobacteria bacterium]|nr:hypothetical protein [Gammaproteobacteria bacterium]